MEMLSSLRSLRIQFSKEERWREISTAVNIIIITNNVKNDDSIPINNSFASRLTRFNMIIFTTAVNIVNVVCISRPSAPSRLRLTRSRRW